VAGQSLEKNSGEEKLLNHRVAARKVDLAPEKTTTVWVQAEIED